MEKTRYWQKTISEAERSGISMREFCRWHWLRETQFYREQDNLAERHPSPMQKSAHGETSVLLGCCLPCSPSYAHLLKAQHVPTLDTSGCIQ